MSDMINICRLDLEKLKGKTIFVHGRRASGKTTMCNDIHTKIDADCKFVVEVNGEFSRYPRDTVSDVLKGSDFAPLAIGDLYKRLLALIQDNKSISINIPHDYFEHDFCNQFFYLMKELRKTPQANITTIISLQCLDLIPYQLRNTLQAVYFLLGSYNYQDRSRFHNLYENTPSQSDFNCIINTIIKNYTALVITPWKSESDFGLYHYNCRNIATKKTELLEKLESLHKEQMKVLEELKQYDN